MEEGDKRVDAAFRWVLTKDRLPTNDIPVDFKVRASDTECMEGVLAERWVTSPSTGDGAYIHMFVVKEKTGAVCCSRSFIETWRYIPVPLKQWGDRKMQAGGLV